MAARPKEGCSYNFGNKVSIYFLVCKGLPIDDVGVSRDTVFQETRSELVLKPPISSKKSWGGYRRTTHTSFSSAGRRRIRCVRHPKPGIIRLVLYVDDAWYKVPLRDGAGLISRGRRKCRMVNTSVPMVRASIGYSGQEAVLRLLLLYASCAWYIEGPTMCVRLLLLRRTY